MRRKLGMVAILLGLVYGVAFLESLDPTRPRKTARAGQPNDPVLARPAEAVVPRLRQQFPEAFPPLDPSAMRSEERQGPAALRERWSRTSELLEAALPHEYTEGWTLRYRGAVLRQRLVDARPSLRAQAEDAWVYPEVLPGVNSVILSEPDRVEEFLEVGAGAPRSYLYSLTIETPDFAFRSGERLEVVDAQESASLRLDEIVYWSSRDSSRALQPEVRVEVVTSRHVRLSVTLPAQQKDETVLLDPSWSITGSLGKARYGHTATLLQDGRVLVAGGYNQGALKLCEIYTPGTGTWSGTGSLITARYFHTATLLGDGTVLVVGGKGSAALASCERFDPATGRWTSTTSLATARYYHTTTLMTTGRPLVVGGFDGINTLGTCESYSPDTQVWITLHSLQQPRQRHAATILFNGTVLVTGGRSIGALSSCEVVEPALDYTWRYVGSLGIGRFDHTATLLGDRAVLAVGGMGAAGELASTELYSMGSETWILAGSLTRTRTSHTASRLQDGRILIAGGLGAGVPVTTCEVYNPQPPIGSPNWSTTAFMQNARTSHTATVLENGKVLVTGGSATSAILKSCELYDPSYPVTPVPETSAANFGWLRFARFRHATGYSGGTVVVTGGRGLNTILKSTEYRVDEELSWKPGADLKEPRNLHTIAYVSPPISFLIAGGLNSDYVGKSEMGDAWDWNYTLTDMASPRYGHTATWLPTVSKVLVAGGYGQGSFSTEFFYSANQAWISLDLLLTPRAFHTATLLKDGRVLFVGGWTGSENLESALAACELYDPSTGIMTSGPPLNQARYRHTATLLADGRVLVVGGYGDGGIHLSTCEIYDPSVSGSIWGTIAPLTLGGRALHTANLLQDGRILVAGGIGQGAPALETCEIYAPSTGTWKKAGPLFFGRREHTATLLDNGKVVFVGGDNGQPMASCELYSP